MPDADETGPASAATGEAVRPSDGMAVRTLDGWGQFHDFIERGLPRAHEFIWRGHREDDWTLESTADRLLRRARANERTEQPLREDIVEAFRFAARGRRGVNPPNIQLNDWWALGQHNGLATPLLDWTRSPFAAAFFAFAEENGSSAYRAVYGLHRPAVEAACRAISADPDHPPVIEFVSPLMDENARLVNQSGLFTLAPDDMTIEGWVARAFAERDELVLVKVRIPNVDRLAALRSLNRMNINYVSLFPDLAGAAQFVNMSTLISEY